MNTKRHSRGPRAAARHGLLLILTLVTSLTAVLALAPAASASTCTTDGSDVATVCGIDISAASGTEFSGDVATYELQQGFEAEVTSATIDWGDGTTSSGTVTGDPTSSGDISGTHTYAAGGSYTITITASGDAEGGAITESVAATATATVSGPPPATGLIIDGLRFSGPNGATDQYVDVYNTTDQPIDATGWYLAYEDGSGSVVDVTLPSDTVPASGHLLVAGSGYSLGPTPDEQTASLAVPATGGVQLLDPSGSVEDAVGFTDAPSGYASGTGIPEPDAYPTAQYGWVRTFADGAPVNTQNNSADFSYVAVGDDDATHGSPVLGDPTPSNVHSPVVHNEILQSTLLDPNVAATAAPNQIVTRGQNGADDTVVFNRTLTNCSGLDPTAVTNCANAESGTTAMNVTDLQFRITGLTTDDSPGTFPAAPTGPSTCNSDAFGVATVCGTDISARAGVEFSGDVGTYSLAQGYDAEVTGATIDWGDGTTSSGTVTGDPTSSGDIAGTHTYSSAGTYTITITASGTGQAPGVGPVSESESATATATVITAVLEAETSPGEDAAQVGAAVTGLTLNPASLSGMGGLNATLGVPSTDVSSTDPLTSGHSINVEFEFKVPQTGSFSFAYNAEDDLVPVAGAVAPTSTTGGSTPSSSAGPPASTVVAGTIAGGSALGVAAGTSGGTEPAATPAPAKKTTTTTSTPRCQAAIASLRVSPGQVADGHKLRLRVRLRHACTPASLIAISSGAFARAHHGDSVVYAAKHLTFTVTIAIPKGRKPGRYTITADTPGSAVARTSVKVTGQAR